MSPFRSSYATYYDNFYTHKDYERECDILREVFKSYATNTPVSILDIGCGTGRHALELSKSGFHVTGVDRSAEMLDIARQVKLGESPTSTVEWICQDLLDLQIPSKFDVALMMFSVIGYLTDNDKLVRGLKNIRAHLELGSLLIFDFWYGPAVLVSGVSDEIREVATENGQLIRLARKSHNPKSQIVEVNFKFWSMTSGGRFEKFSEKHVLRYFFPQEVNLLLAASGFKAERLSSFPSLDEEISNDIWSALVVARAV